MTDFQNQVEIGRPIGDVFAYLSDLENVPEWNYAIQQTVKITPGPIRVGTEFRQTRSLPRPSEETIRVARLEPPDALEVSGTLGPFRARLIYELTPTEAGTRLVNPIHLTASGPMRILARLATGRMRRAVAENLNVLKGILEQGARAQS